MKMALSSRGKQKIREIVGAFALESQSDLWPVVMSANNIGSDEKFHHEIENFETQSGKLCKFDKKERWMVNSIRFRFLYESFIYWNGEILNTAGWDITIS